MKVKFPGFKILDRYILGKFLSTYFFAIAMIIVVVVIFDYVEHIDDFTELKAPLKAILFDYYLNFIPFFVNQFSGLFTFIACIFFTSKMAYQTEIVAMLSGGMSFRRLMWPYFLGAAIIGSLSLFLNLWLIPLSQRSIVDFEQHYVKRRMNAQYDRHIYRQIEPGVFAYIREYRDADHQARFFALEHYDGGTMTRSLEAADATFNPETKRWTAPPSIRLIESEPLARCWPRNSLSCEMFMVWISSLMRPSSVTSRLMSVSRLRNCSKRSRPVGSKVRCV